MGRWFWAELETWAQVNLSVFFSFMVTDRLDWSLGNNHDRTQRSLLTTANSKFGHLGLISEDGSLSFVAAPCWGFGRGGAWIFTRAIIPIHLPPYRLSGAAQVSWREACCLPSSEISAGRRQVLGADRTVSYISQSVNSSHTGPTVIALHFPWCQLFIKHMNIFPVKCQLYRKLSAVLIFVVSPHQIIF